MAKSKNIKFSIVIALAPWRDAEILSSIKKLNYPKNKFEVIIRKGTNAPINRNEGIRAAKGEIIIFLDDDGQIRPDFLKEVDYFFKNYPRADIVGGPQLTPDSDKFFARVSGYAMSSAFGGGGTSKRYRKEKITLNADSNYISGALMICKRKVFDSLVFDPNIYPGDDTNFLESAKKKGFVVAFSPNIPIYHRRRPTFQGFVQQVSTFGYTRASIKIIRENFSPSFFYMPSLFVLYLLVLPFLYLINNLFLLPLFLYIFLDVIFSLKLALSNKDILSLILLPFMFPIMHISYGVAFIIGLIKSGAKPK